MIGSFGHEGAERIRHGRYVTRIDRSVQRAVLRKLEPIHAAKDPADLRVPPGKRLERPARASRYPRQCAVAALLRVGGMELRRTANSSTSADAGRIEPIRPGDPHGGPHRGFGSTRHQLAVAIGVPPRWINEILHGRRGITADAATRLARYVGTSAETRMNPQAHYELRLRRPELGDRIGAIAPPRTA